MTKLSPTEIVDIARQIEACGELWYDAAAGVVEDEAIRARFLQLRDDERRHAGQFEQLLTRFADDDGVWRDNDEYLTWAAAMANGRVFAGPEAAETAARMLRDDAEAIRVALQFEHQTISFLETLRPLMADSCQELLSELIAEEHEHVKLLEALTG